MVSPRHPLLVAVLLAAALVAAGCGNKESIRKNADTEGLFVNVGPLAYQVQLSRYLNPYDVEDREFLQGLPRGTKSEPGPGELWFGVFIQVHNFSSQVHRPTASFSITDTQKNVYRPIPLANTNVVAFHPQPLGPSARIPDPVSAAGNLPINGSLLLFKIKTSSVQNRPLVFHISGGPNDVGTVQLDL